MTPTPTPCLPLDPATLAAIQRDTIDALPPRAHASEADKAAQRDGALAFLAALHPRDVMQATLATRVVAAHYGAMECFRRAARDDLPAALHACVMGKAVALCRLMDATLRELAQRQAGQAMKPAALPASVPAAQAHPAPDAAPASASAQPPRVEGRHERRRRERAERHVAALMQRAGLAAGASATAMQQRAQAEAAARAAAPATALAA